MKRGRTGTPAHAPAIPDLTDRDDPRLVQVRMEVAADVRDIARGGVPIVALPTIETGTP